MTTPRNPFRDRTMRQNYDAAVKVYRMRHRDLFIPQTGERRRSGNYGSTFARCFWHGFDDVATPGERQDRAWRQTIGYAFWRAGRDLAKLENKTARPS